MSFLSYKLLYSTDFKLKLCVLYNQEEETVFVVKPTTLFKKIRTAIAKKYGIEEKSFKMNYESANCLDDFTPKMMEMQVGRSYRLDTFTEQVGGRLVCPSVGETDERAC
jgi:hypothetical protein